MQYEGGRYGRLGVADAIINTVSNMIPAKKLTIPSIAAALIVFFSAVVPLEFKGIECIISWKNIMHITNNKTIAIIVGMFERNMSQRKPNIAVIVAPRIKQMIFAIILIGFKDFSRSLSLVLITLINSKILGI